MGMGTVAGQFRDLAVVETAGPGRCGGVAASSPARCPGVSVGRFERWGGCGWHDKASRRRSLVVEVRVGMGVGEGEGEGTRTTPASLPCIYSGRGGCVKK